MNDRGKYVTCQGCAGSSGSCARCGGTGLVWRYEGQTLGIKPLKPDIVWIATVAAFSIPPFLILSIFVDRPFLWYLACWLALTASATTLGYVSWRISQRGQHNPYHPAEVHKAKIHDHALTDEEILNEAENH